jgi:hypothetical protein
MYFTRKFFITMLDLAGGETERIESRFLEPTCGTVDSLALVLERKLAIVKKG